MKIKIYIVTYRNNLILNECLSSLYQSYYPSNVNFEINIINNHSIFKIDNIFSKVNIINNKVRPDFSTGHLARDWNCAIVNGFKSLKNPDCDILVTCQNDTLFNKHWFERILNFHVKYSFITAAPGDGVCSYTPDAIKNIGLWDERFNSIHYQEADYFTRALIFNKTHSSINDFHHNRTHNTILNGEFDKSLIYRNYPDLEIHNATNINSEYNLKLLESKYINGALKRWDKSFIENPSQLKEKLYLTYPYFEKDILGLNDKYHLF